MRRLHGSQATDSLTVSKREAHLFLSRTCANPGLGPTALYQAQPTVSVSPARRGIRKDHTDTATLFSL